jgi:hypothetical protein
MPPCISPTAEESAAQVSEIPDLISVSLKNFFGGGPRCIGSTLPMQRGELGGRHLPVTAVRPDLVVVLPLGGDRGPGLRQHLESMVVQAFVPELAVEALDVAVLNWPAWLNQDVANAMGLCAAHKRPAGKFRPVIGTDHIRIAPKQRCRTHNN